MNKSDIKSKQDAYFTRCASYVLAASTLLALGIIVWSLFRSQYGFDITDEAFYLNWMNDPWLYSVSISQFGFVYHPLSLLLHGNITLLRQANILITVGLTWVLFLLFFRSTLHALRQKSTWHTKPMIVLAGIFASTSCIFLCPFGWLATPSYNTLTLQGLLLVSVGFLLAEKTVSRTSILGWIIIALAGWLVFLAKPSSAAMLAVVAVMYIILSDKINYKLMLLSLLTTGLLFCITAWLMDGSILVFIERYQQGLAEMHLMQAGSSLLGFTWLPYTYQEKYFLTRGTFTLSVITWLCTSNKKYFFYLGLSFLLILVFVGFAIIFGLIPIKVDLYHVPITRMLVVPLSAIVVVMVRMRLHVFYVMSRAHWAILFFLILLPYVLAFGTSNNYWVQSQLADIFFVLAGLVFFMPLTLKAPHWEKLLPLAVGAQVIALVLLKLAMDHPYAQSIPLDQSDTQVVIGSSNSALKFHPTYADFIKKLQGLLQQQGFKPDTPVIDLTGQSPGILYIMGAKPIGSAWMIGGYPGSNLVATSMLSRVSCKDISTAWLLIEPNGLTEISSSALSPFGINLEKDYIMAFEFDLPKGLGRRNTLTHQLLLRPVRSNQDATDACEKMKREQQ